MLPLLMLGLATVGVNAGEYGSYINPNPRPYERCEAEDLIKQSACFNDILSKLDICVADDLACECCALQQIDQGCFHLCPTNPSANFLNTLVNDCSALNDVNACSLRFAKYTPRRRPSLAPIQEDYISVKSKIVSESEVPSRVSLVFDFEELASLAPIDENSVEATLNQTQFLEPIANFTQDFTNNTNSSNGMFHVKYLQEFTNIISSFTPRFQCYYPSNLKYSTLPFGFQVVSLDIQHMITQKLPVVSEMSLDTKYESISHLLYFSSLRSHMYKSKLLGAIS